MVYRPHTLITCSGTLTEISSQDEIWQIGVRGFNPTSGADTPVDAGQLQNLADAVWTGVAAWFVSANARHPTSTFLREVKCANIGADGKYTAEAATHEGSQAGGSSTGFLQASFLCVAYSFSTAAPGRKAKNGRVYPPNFAAGITTGAQVSSTDVTALLTAEKAFLDALNVTGSEFAFRPAVVSSQGPYAYINSISINNVYDVQRRRKNAVAGGRTGQAYTPAH